MENFPYVGIAISQNQYWRICSRNSLVMGYLLCSPMTESMPQYGQIAVPPTSSIQLLISLGAKIFRQ